MYKAYIILRKDLDISVMKLGVQVGHATDILWKNRWHNIKDFTYWQNKDFGDRRKILLEVKNLNKLENIRKNLEDEGFSCFNVFDSGYTELNKKTLTAIVVFPTEKISKKLKRLRLLS